MFLTFKGFMIKTQKRPNTEPQGIPEADDRFFGKVIYSFFYNFDEKQ